MKPIQYEIIGDCFICTSHYRDKDGYPILSRNRRNIRIHRYIYEQCFGEIPKGMVVRHTCDTRSCINPEHLIIGTQADNIKDRDNRHRTARGERAGQAKLTERDVREIRESNLSSTVLAEKYNVSARQIRRIRSRQLWKHVQ